MKNYIYIEVLRQVCPVQQYNDFHFFLLGGFDAMKVYFDDSIGALKKAYEKDQNDTPSLFDRQPMFLYTDQDMDDSNAKQNIFGRLGIYAARPLVITLFQLDKRRLARQDGFDTPDRLINEFAELIGKELHGKGCPAGQISYQVFWNLGESDMTVVFRPATLKLLAGVLHSLRTKEYSSSDPIRIKSTCSHCAFPKPEGLGSLADDEKEVRIATLLRQWITGEFDVDEVSEFITLVNTSDGYNNIDPSAEFLFGEWDYLYRHQYGGVDELIAFLKTIFSFLVKSEGNSHNSFPFRTSYTIPAISVKTSADCCGLGSPGNRQDANDDSWIEELSASMDNLGNCIPGLLGNHSHEAELAESIQSFKCSIVGLAKFLYRLREGRFEEDLYIYVQPVFVRLTRITENYTENVKVLKDVTGDARKQIDVLVKEYISSTSELIESLQHLFSIMAVSPHTFMETYGSNMRSLSASDKLLDAYQGIIRFLKKNFPGRIEGAQTEQEILILPYRKAQSTHTLLYQQSDPKNRISYIQIDFTKMFNLQATVFMLLHECGHHLGDRLRDERFDHLVKSAVCMVFEWGGLGDLIYDPVNAFITRTKSKRSSGRQKEALFLGMDQSAMEKYEKDIMNKVQAGIYEAGNTLGGFIARSYPYYRISYRFLDVFYENHYGKQVIDYLRIVLPLVFGFNQSGDNPDAYGEHLEIVRKSTADIIEENIGEELSRIAKDMSEDIIQRKGNVREALRLKTVYADKKLFVRDMFDGSQYIIKEQIYQGLLNKLYSIFSDIYSDIFSICILDIDMKTYIEIIPALLGIEKTEILNDQFSLCRVRIVSETLWPDKVDRDKILDWLCIDDSAKEFAYEKWGRFKKTPYRRHLSEYACRCRERMDELIREAKSADEKTLNQLRNIFKEDLSTQMNAVYYFFQYLMK